MILENPSHTIRRRWVGAVAGVLLVAWGAFVLTGSAEARTVPSKAEDVKKIEFKTQDGKQVVVAVDAKAVEGEVDVTTPKIIVFKKDDGMMHVEVHAGTAAVGQLHEGNFTWVGDDGEKSSDGQLVRLALLTHSSDKELAEFAENHPTADADADGKVSATERKAYLVALAMIDPDAVVTQFPHADRNDNGQLEATEAARLVGIRSPHIARNVVRWRLKDDNVAVSGTLESAEVKPTLLHRIYTTVEATVDETQENGQTKLKWVVPALREGQAESDDGEPRQMIVMAPTAIRFSPKTDPGHWLLENIDATPTTAEVANFVTTVEQAPMAMILERHPDADTDGDGVLSTEERDSFFEALRAKSKGMLESLSIHGIDGTAHEFDLEALKASGKAVFIGKDSKQHLITVTPTVEGQAGETQKITVRLTGEQVEGEPQQIIVTTEAGEPGKVIKLKLRKKEKNQ